MFFSAIDHDGDEIEAELFLGKVGYVDGVELRQGGQDSAESIFIRPEVLPGLIVALQKAQAQVAEDQG